MRGICSLGRDWSSGTLPGAEYEAKRRELQGFWRDPLDVAPDPGTLMRIKETPPPARRCPQGGLTIQRSHRLVSLAVRRVTLAGAMSGGAWRVWILLEGWLGGLVPTMFTWRMRKLGQVEEGERDGESGTSGPKPAV